MTKDMKNASTASQTPKFPGFDPTAMMRSFMAKMSEASASGGNPTAGWLEVHQHWMTFLSDRFKQDAALLQRLATCSNPSEMTDAYTDFYKASVADYQLEFAEITKINQKTMANTLTSGEAVVGNRKD